MREVTQVRATPHLLGRRLDLSWRNPRASDFQGGAPFAGIRIVRRERMYPRDASDGEIVYDGPITARFSDLGLAPLTHYCYKVFTADADIPAVFRAGEDSQATGFATEDFGLAERLYRLLPAVHQRLDRALDAARLQQLSPAVRQALDSLPEALRGAGQLRRLFHSAAPFDLMRSFAEGLPQLHNVDSVRPEFLPMLAHWLGWRLDRTLTVYEQRNEIKFAPRLFRQTGSVPNIRQLVNKYTGWHAQAAEFEQHVQRSNSPPQLNIFSITEDADGWRDDQDAGPALGFPPGNHEATGAPALPAVLAGGAFEPFALSPDAKLTVTADDRVPVTVVFRPGDFANIAAAGAAEVAAVLNRHLSELTAAPIVGGAIELRSHTLGPDSSLRVERHAAGLVTLEGAPRGRISAFSDPAPALPGRTRLFYESADPEAPATDLAARRILEGKPHLTGVAPGEDPADAPREPGAKPVLLPQTPQGRLRYKTYRAGVWGESRQVRELPENPEGEPAAARLPDGRIFLAWLENPNTGDARLRWRLGNVRQPRPARLQGRLNQPFRINPGSQLSFRGIWPEPEVFEFADLDFVDPQQATALEVVAALNARLTRVSAAVQPDQTILLETLSPGGDQRLEIGLEESGAAASLGFDQSNSVSAGSWGDQIDWDPAEDVPAAPPGRHRDLHALVDATGAVWLFWANHSDAAWRIVSSRWNGVVWSAAELLAEELGGNREPCASLDPTGRIWLFWSRRQGVSTPEDVWTLRSRIFDPGIPAWGPEASVTTPPPGRAADRQPGAILLAGGNIRLFFQSDRNGGPDLWELTVDTAAETFTAPQAVTNDHYADHWPCPLRHADGRLSLLHRSDRSISAARLTTRSLPEPDNRLTRSRTAAAPSDPPAPPRSIRAADTGTIKRFAGSTSVTLGDAARIGRRRLYDDLLGYTPQKPRGWPWEAALQPDELYTRGTLGLYLSQVVPESPLSIQKVERLRPALERFLPINVRAVVILAPRVDVELVYSPQNDLQESYLDQHPDIERYSGLGDSAEAALPDWILLLSNLADHVSADPADLNTLQRRTYFPPPE